jgi:hypothetical protein
MFTLVYVGCIVSIIGALPLVLGGAMNMMKASVMVKNMEHVGFSPDVLSVFGFIKIVIVAMSLVPATSFIGVIGNGMDGRSHLGTHPGDRPVFRPGPYPHRNLGRVWPSSSRRNA